MSTKTETRRNALRDTLVDLAEETIADGGLAALKARDLAARAGCSVGAIYNAAGGLPEIILMVNARTFERLGASVTQGMDAATTPTEQLITLSHGYLAFATAHHSLWRAMFELPRTPGEPVPEWYLGAMGRLFTIIEGPLERVFPDLSDSDLNLMARALFSSVHGMVLMGLERASGGVPQDELERMLALVIGAVARP